MDDAKKKLEKELRNIARLKQTVNKSGQLTNGMCTILSSFDDRLMKLERTILPVYHETGNLQRRQENIEKTLNQLDYVIQFYNVSKCVEPTIQKGPGENLPLFLEYMERIQKGIDYFEKNNSDNSEYALLESLFSRGKNAIVGEFEDVLSRYSKPITPIAILDLVELDEELNQQEEKNVEYLPEKVVNELIQMAEWLRKNNCTTYADKYAQIRSRTLAKSMQGLKEHQKACSGNSANLLTHSPLLGGRKNARDTPPRRVSKKIQEAFMRKTGMALMKRGGSEGTSMLGIWQTSRVQENKEEIMEQEIEAYLTCITALYKLMQNELALMRGIIPYDMQKLVFEKVVHTALESVMSEGENLAARVKRCIAKHDFLSVLCLFPVLRHITATKQEYEMLFDGCTEAIGNKLPALAVTLQITIHKALEEFVDSIKNDPDTKMPKDGTVHELTSNVMMLLEHLQNFIDMVGHVFSLSDFASIKQTNDPNRLTLAQYITRVLAALNLTLTNKSETYSDSFLKSIFRLNNLQYILKSLQKSGLLEVVHLFRPEIEEQYLENIRDQKRIYSQSWSRVLHYVLEVDRPISQQRTSPAVHQSSLKLKDKDRQSIKDRFTGFNKELEEIYKVQKAYAIPDVELRENLKRDNKEYIIPKYEMFFEKYRNVHFTKNKDKYLKYTSLQVSELIDKFFDAAA